ncbi:MAG: hypothetical protein AAF810_05400 [Cyanobacteria bacterium P01_D01_bin.36]
MAIRHKRKNTANYEWQSGDLVSGQIGLNIADGTLHFQKSDNSTVLVPNSRPAVNTQTATTYTFASTDGLASNGFVVANPTADATYTIPLDSSVAFPNNDAIQGRNDSLFNITIEGDTGVSFNTIIVPPNAYFVIQRKAADDWISASTGYPTTSWARINGTVGGLGIISGDGPYKPTGVSRTGVGLYTITIPDTGTTEYGIAVSGRSGPSQGSYVVESGNFTRTSTQFGVIALNAFDGQGNAAQDQNEFVVLIIV